MRFKLYREYGALNSGPIFDAFEQGMHHLGHETVNDNEEVSVIWSVLWSGRMKNNKSVYTKAKNEGRQICIIEVGNLRRGITWRISLDHINNLGNFANTFDIDPDRPQKLGVSLMPPPEKRRGEILIACQHQESLQWEGMPPARVWCEDIITKIKSYTHRRIIIRPHPRSPFPCAIPNILVEKPKKIANTYDDFDINYNYHCVINHNSGPAVQASIKGVPVLTDTSSLAYPMSMTWNELDNPYVPDRQDWFLKLCHTEYTIEEISKGVPLTRLFS